jgi:hypothetical protein
MDIKKANVNLLLGKVGELLKKLPDETKKGNEFAEADKALARLKEIFAGHDGEIELMACKAKIHVVPGS